MSKNAYLTIDDAPSRDFRKKIDYLIANEIDAIIFCVGNQVFEPAQREDLIYAVENGYLLGNHSHSHQRFSRLDAEKSKKEISKTDKIIDGLYDDAGIQRPIKVFRFPYGDPGGKNAGIIQEYLVNLGYSKPAFKNICYDFYNEHEKNNIDVYWTFNVMEYDFTSEQDIDGRLSQEDGRLGCEIGAAGGCLSSQSNEIIDIHDYAYTTKYFPKIIDSFIEKGVSFLGIPISGDDLRNHSPNTIPA